MARRHRGHRRGGRASLRSSRIGDRPRARPSAQQPRPVRLHPSARAPGDLLADGQGRAQCAAGRARADPARGGAARAHDRDRHARALPVPLRRSPDRIRASRAPGRRLRGAPRGSHDRRRRAQDPRRLRDVDQRRLARLRHGRARRPPRRRGRSRGPLLGDLQARARPTRLARRARRAARRPLPERAGRVGRDPQAGRGVDLAVLAAAAAELGEEGREADPSVSLGPKLLGPDVDAERKR